MTLHNYRSRQVHETLNGVNPSSSFRDMRSAKSGPNLWQIWQVFGPWASPYRANGHMNITVHTYRPRQFHRTSNGENPSSGYRDMGSASLAAARPAARPPARPPARTVTTIPLQPGGLRGKKSIRWSQWTQSALSMMTWDQRFHHVEQAMVMERWWNHGKVHQISITDVSEGGAMMKIYQVEFRVSSLHFCPYGPTLCIEYQYMAWEIILMNHWSLTNGLAVIPALEVHPLSEQFNGRLSPVHLEGRHVQVVHKEHQVLAQRRTKHTLTSER